MKNVKGEEIYSSLEEKADFYNKVYNKEIVKPEAFNRHITGKDDYFNEKLMPFCKLNKLKSALDVGANHGAYAARLYDAGFRVVTATELTPERTQLLRKTLDHYGYPQIAVWRSDIETEQRLAYYDLIFLADVLEHLESYELVWQKCLDHAKFVYALVPVLDSWNWSPDHVIKFDFPKINKLLEAAPSIIFYAILDYDGENKWYSFLVKGRLC